MNETLKGIFVNGLWTVVAATLGFACIAAPAAIHGQLTGTHAGPLFPVVTAAMENMAPIAAAIALFLLGLSLGFLQPRIWWILALSAVAVFPICTVIEIAFFPESHNLWPLEFAMIGVLDLPALVGAYFGSRLSARRNMQRLKSSTAGQVH